jgi:hypothetical protein
MSRWVVVHNQSVMASANDFTPRNRYRADGHLTKGLGEFGLLERKTHKRIILGMLKGFLLSQKTITPNQVPCK